MQFDQLKRREFITLLGVVAARALMSKRRQIPIMMGIYNLRIVG